MAREIILGMKNITKDFPGVRALDDINFELATWEIHALVGENGAGKSTLMSVLAGVHTDFMGTIIMDGRPVRFANPKEAIENGIGIIYQENGYISDYKIYTCKEAYNVDNLFWFNLRCKGVRFFSILLPYA